MPTKAIFPACLALLLAAAAPAAEPTVTVDLGDGVSLELILVKKGSFRQGSPADEPGRSQDEVQREVSISKDFYLGKYPVTRGQFARFVAETGHRTEAERGTSGGFGWDGSKLTQRKDFTWRNPGFPQSDDHPVTVVTFADAGAFLDWLSRRAGRACVLPTEAQWEYACRAGTTTAFSNGGAKDATEIAWFKDNAGHSTHPAGQKKPNAWGLYDMCGNVFEWCRDWYGPYEPGPVTDPEEKRSDRSDKPRRVLRGGSWLGAVDHCRSAARYRNDPGSRNADNGFRVLTATETERSQPPVGVPVPQTPGMGTPPPPVEQPRPGSDFLGSWECFGLLCVGLVGLAVLVIRMWSRPGRFGDTAGAVRVPPESVRSRVGPDGFWLDAPNIPPGSVVRYRYRIDGEERTGEVTYTPGAEGQFVYTGGMPADVEVLAIVPPGTTWSGGTPWVQGLESPPLPPPRPSPPPFTGYPPAY
jgi:formylglycine-generating enzyme required for sulfatase activity